MMHAYRLDGNDLRELFIWQPMPDAGENAYGYRALPIALAYALAAAIFALAAWRQRRCAADRAEADTIERSPAAAAVTETASARG
jgi:hypothetical protein